MDPASLSTIFANVAFFVIFQCIFFYVVVSKKYEATLSDKSGIIKTFVENSPLIGKLLCKKLLKDASSTNATYEGIRWTIATDPSQSDIIEDHTLEERLKLVEEKLYELHKNEDDTYKIGNVVKSGEKYYKCISIREAKDILNRRALLKTMSMFVVPSLIICIILVVVSLYQKKWGKHHSLAMVLIAGCFSTEIIFYLLVLEGHIIVGDWELIHNLFKK